jgi:gliding motility-associated-like protein
MQLTLKLFVGVLLLVISTTTAFSQTLIMNEVSNGPAGNQEYVEFVVVDTVVAYNCSATAPPCIDIRGWIFDDNSGYHGAAGIAAGAVRFSFDPLWACVPLGTIILIYNDADLNPEIPAVDISMADGNCRISAPISNTALFEKNATTPGAIACSYPASGWTAGGIWSNTLLANPGDCARIVDLGGCEVFSVCWAAANTNTLIYFNSGGSGSQNVWYFTDGDPEVQANWSEGSAAIGANQTPGAPNNVANAAFIGQFNNNCSIITPIAVTASSTDPICTCTGTATANASGSIAGYTYEWFTSAYVPIGQTTATATGLCQGTYHVIATSSIGCSDTATVTLNATGSTTVSVNNATICQGQTTTLTATPSTGGGTYLWSPGGETTQTILVSPGSTTTFSVTYTLGTCSNSNTGEVTVNPSPVLVITNPSGICSPATVNLTAAAVTAGSTNPGTLSYWTNAAATTALASPSAVATSGTYYIQASNAGCTDIDAVTVTVNPSPVLVITNPTAVCSPLTVDLTAAAVTAGSTNPGTLSYWTNATATTALASPSAVATSGTYYIQANNAGCTDIEAVTVTINPSPVLVITNPSAVCSPSTIDLTAAAVTSGSTNPGTLSYWTNAAATTALASPSAVATSGTYYIQANNAGCTDIEAVTVTINPSPVLVITNPSAVCSPLTVDLTAAAVTAGSTNPGTLSYWTNAAATTALASPSAVAASGTYYIQASNAGCTDIEAVTVTINQTPVLVITNPSAVCSPATVNLTAAAVTAGSTNPGTLSYWTNAAATTALASPSAVATSGTYYIQASNAGCTDIEAVTVTINPSPVLVITNPTAVCSPATVNLTAAAVTAGSTNSGTLSYWTNATATTALASPSAVSTSGTYYIQASNAGCTDIEAVTVTIVTTPIVVTNDPTAICSPNTIDLTLPALTAGSSNLSSMSYWMDVAATIPVADPTAVSASGTYYIQSGISGCSDIEAVTVVINSSPILVINDPSAVCLPSTVDLTAAAITLGSTNSGTLSYWTNAAATISLTSPSSVAASGTYYIQATNAGCTDIEAVNVSINPIPVAPSAGTDATYCSSWEYLAMTVVGTGGIYTWYSDSSLNSTLGIGNSLMPSDVVGTTVYYVTETVNSCESLASAVTIIIEDCEIIVPTAFTPDGDNVNDYWEIVDLDEVYPNNIVMIYNRWGGILYQSEKGKYASDPWNGEYKEKELPVGSYYFIIDFQDENVEPQKGIVSIIRQ